MENLKDFNIATNSIDSNESISNFLLSANLNQGGEWLNYVSKFYRNSLVLEVGKPFRLFLILKDNQLLVKITSPIYNWPITLKNLSNEEITKLHSLLLVASYCEPKSQERYCYDEKQNKYSQFIKDLTNDLLTYNENKCFNADITSVLPQEKFDNIIEKCRAETIVKLLIKNKYLLKETFYRKYPRDINKLESYLRKRENNNER